MRRADVEDAPLQRALRHLQVERVVNLHGYVSVQRFYIYAERGLSRRRVSVWLYDRRLSDGPSLKAGPGEGDIPSHSINLSWTGSNARLHDFACYRPDGYETCVRQHGVTPAREQKREQLRGHPDPDAGG